MRPRADRAGARLRGTLKASSTSTLSVLAIALLALSKTIRLVRAPCSCSVTTSAWEMLRCRSLTIDAISARPREARTSAGFHAAVSRAIRLVLDAL